MSWVLLAEAKKEITQEADARDDVDLGIAGEVAYGATKEGDRSVLLARRCVVVWNLVLHVHVIEHGYKTACKHEKRRPRSQPLHYPSTKSYGLQH
jgi:hypothetical protein